MSEIYDLLFHYKDRPDRAEYFKRIIAFYPPNRLMREWNVSLDLGIAGTPTITNFLTTLETQYYLGYVDDLALRRAAHDMIYTIAKRSSAV